MRQPPAESAGNTISMRAVDYIRQTSDAIRDRYTGDCVVHASRVAALLLADGFSPWIGVVRDVVEKEDTRFHGPLLPRRYAGKGAMAWTSHYVACADNEAYDPLVGSPKAVDVFALEVFGKPLEVRAHLDAVETERLLANGQIRTAFRPERIVLRRGDITAVAADAIVNPGGAVGLAIHAAAGPELEVECMSIRRGVPRGDAVITAAYRLRAKYVIHAVGASWHGGKRREVAQLTSLYRRCFQLVKEHGIRTIAFPAISCGVYSFPPPVAAEIAVRETAAALRSMPNLERVTFVLFTDELCAAYSDAVREFSDIPALICL